MKDILAIVGSHTDTRDMAPWNDPRVEIWCMNEAVTNGWAKRVDAIFQLHDQAIYTNPHNAGHWDWLQQPHDFPIYMQRVDPRVPASVAYPLDEVRQFFFGDAFTLAWPDASKPADYFTSSFAFAIALAIKERRFAELHLYGVEMASGSEYEYQLQGVMFWLGVARGAGLRLRLYSAKAHFDKLVYAYDGGEVWLDEAYLAGRADELRAQFAVQEREHLKLKDKIKDLLYKAKGDTLIARVKERENLALEQGMVAGALGQADGHLERMRKIKAETGQQYLIDRHACEITAAKAGLKASELEARMHMHKGVVEYLWNAWRQLGTLEARAQLAERIEKLIATAYEVGSYRGIYAEMTTYMVEMDARYTAAGGAKTIAALEQQGIIAPAEVAHVG